MTSGASSVIREPLCCLSSRSAMDAGVCGSMGTSQVGQNWVPNF
jgi:hypothetical protein